MSRLPHVAAGPTDAPAVVLLHGFPTSSRLWRSLQPALVPAMRSVAPDLFRTDGADVDRETEAVRALLDDLGIASCAVVGHGHGAAVARRLAAVLDVRALVLIDDIEGAAIGDLDATDVSRAFADLFAEGLGHPERLPLEVLEAYAAPFVADPDLFGRVGAALARRADPPPSADVPTLLLWGEDDPYAPVERAERLADAIPGATLAVLPGCSHFLPDDAADTVVPLVVEWLRGRYLGSPHRHAEGPVEVFLGRRPPPEAERMDT